MCARDTGDDPCAERLDFGPVREAAVVMRQQRSGACRALGLIVDIVHPFGSRNSEAPMLAP